MRVEHGQPLSDAALEPLDHRRALLGREEQLVDSVVRRVEVEHHADDRQVERFTHSRKGSMPDCVLRSIV